MKVLALHYWDTRGFLKNRWPHNVAIVWHNWQVLTKNLPPGLHLEQHIFLNWVAEIRCVQDLAASLFAAYGAHVHRWGRDLREYKHLVVFNVVAERAHRELEDRIPGFDFVFTLSQDILLVNHFPDNFFVVMADLLEGKRRDLGHWWQDRYDYLGHTIGAQPDRNRYRHNPGLCRGLYKTSKLPLVMQALSQTTKAAETYLGRDLGEQALFLQPHPLFYHSDYSLQSLTREKADTLLYCAGRVGFTHKIPEIRHR